MNLSRRIILTVVISDVILIGILFSAVGTIMLNNFTKVEGDNVERNIGRVNDALKADLTTLSSKNGDWSNWDDVYNYVVGDNPGFVAANLTPNSFAQLEVSTMLFYDNNHSLVVGRAASDDYSTVENAPKTLTEEVKNSRLLEHPNDAHSYSGLIQDGDAVYLLSSRAILTGDGEGPAHGSLLFLKKINGQFVKMLADTVHLDVEFVTMASAHNADNYVQAVADIQENDGSKVDVVSDTTIRGQSLVSDINFRPIGYWEFVQDRSIYKAGQSSARVFFLLFVVVGALFAAALLYVLETYVLRRLKLFAATVKNIERTEDLTIRLPIKTQDEMGTLGNAINNLLDRIGGSIRIIKGEQAELRKRNEYSTTLQQTIKQERDQATAIIESMGEGLLVLNNKFEIVRINKTAQQLLGVTEKAAVGQEWNKFVIAYAGDEKIPMEHRSALKVMKTGKAVSTKLEDDHYFETQTGHKFPVVSTTTPYKIGGLTGVVVVFRDVTKEQLVRSKVEDQVKERTEEVQEIKARLISSINSLTVGFVMTDMSQNILLINETALNILHFDGEPAGLDTGDDRIHNATIKSMAESMGGKYNLLAGIKQCLSYKKPVSVQDIAIGQRDVELYISPILFGAKVLGAVILIIDVSSEKQLARAKDDFLSIASHELRTPLTAIMGNASMIQEYFAKDIKSKDFREMVADMKSASTRLIDLVNDFLNVSRLEQGRLTFRQESVSLLKTAQEVVKELEPSKKAGVTLSIATKEDLVVSADTMKLKEVLINLAGNSLKYTEKGSVVISWEKREDSAYVRITDTGIGIDAKNQSLLFQKFQQAGVNNITRDTKRSSGLGLYISRLLMNNMNGQVGLESSAMGKGSTFFVSLPLDKLGKGTKS